jgi:hypothetical protein
MTVKLQMNTAAAAEPTASEALIAKAAANVELVDELNRKLVIRKPGVLATYRMVEALGPEKSQNATLVNMYLPLVFLVSIDGEPIGFPNNPLEVDAIVTALGDEGLDTLLEGVKKHFGKTDPEADRVKLKK